MRNQSQIYLALFLMVFGLFASQIKKKHVVEKVVQPALTDVEPALVNQTRIELLYQKISNESFFSNKISGIKLTPNGGPIQNEFMITYYGEEVFSEDRFSIHDSWHSSLDRLAEIMLKERGLKIEISGYVDEAIPHEKSPIDFSSAYALSFARAEWLAHYFEKKHGMVISKTMVLRGMGSVPGGKKVEIKFYFNSSKVGGSFKNSGSV